LRIVTKRRKENPVKKKFLEIFCLRGRKVTESYTVKEGTKIISPYAFQENVDGALTEITMPDSVEYIGEEA